MATAAVVNIFATRRVKRRLDPFMGDPFFNELFGNSAESVCGSKARRDQGDPDVRGGLVVSNHHVIVQANGIRVVLHDRRKYAARVIPADQGTDLAVLRSQNAAGLPSLELRDSDRVEVGDQVTAIGNPLRFRF